MLRLDSYLSPFLLSYLSKYIKDIEAKDLQLSLWGGEAVLHNLQFKLDALDNELGDAPFTFVSCQAQELRIHVPWSKLQSESVIVTLNRVECVIKLSCRKTKAKPKQSESKENAPAQSSYIESIINKIKNNIIIKVNNLILKYVEDDIVLSVNMQSASYQPVDEWWKPAFVEIAETSPVLRRTFEFKDMTICLDKRGASGLVESYDEPMLFRSHFVFRQHTTFPSHTSRKPSATKINLMIERYELNISDKQLPPFLHLLELCLHLYYKRIEVTVEENSSTHAEEDLDGAGKPGWASWAWSYVPPVLSYDIHENEVKDPVFAFGLYIKNILIRFKPSRIESTRQFHSLQNSHSKPLIEMVAEGFSLEMVAKGLNFFSCITSLCNGSIKFESGVPLKVDGKCIPEFGDDIILLGSAGGPVSGFAADSLFDFRSPENNNTLFEYPLSYDSFFLSSSKNESAVFLSQYLYIATDARKEEDQNETEFEDFLSKVDLADVDEWSNLHEKSWKRFTIGGNSCHIAINSYSLMCAEILLSWASNHTLKPYPLAPDQSIHAPEVLKDVQFIPTRSSTFIFKNVNIALPALCLQVGNYKEKTYHRIDALEKGSSTQTHSHHNRHNSLLPTIVVQVPLATFTIKQPMYATQFAAYLSCYLSPLPRLMRFCNTQYTVDVPLIACYLWTTIASPSDVCHFPEELEPFLKVKSIVMENHSLQGEKYWKSRTTMLKSQTKILIQAVSVDVAPIQVEMLLHTADSWLHLLQKEKNVDRLLDVHFLQTVLGKSGKSCRLCGTFNGITTEISMSFANTFLCGALRLCDVHLLSSVDQVIPLIQCNHSCKSMYLPEHFTDICSEESHHLDLGNVSKQSLDWNEENRWLSVYLQIPSDSQDIGCVLANIGPVFVNVDPFIFDVLLDMPSVTLNQLLPFLHSFQSSETSFSSDETNIKMLNSKLAIQVRNKGIQVFALQNITPVAMKTYQLAPAVQIMQERIKSSDNSVLCVSFPQVTVFTSGFKPIKISPALLKQGVQVNSFTEFSTLNCCCEHATAYTVHSVAGENCVVNFLTKPCAATCTLVLRQIKESKTSVVLHLDLDPIELKVSKEQVELLVIFCNSIQNTLCSIAKNCALPVVTSTHNAVQEGKKSSLKQLDITSESRNITNETSQVYGNDHKSNSATSVLQAPSPVVNKLSFTLWLQCTLPRFSFAVYSDPRSKTMLCIDDVSLSLDLQVVYLKLMTSFSTCDVTHWLKVDDQWIKGDLMSFMLSPMFSVLPSFVQKFDTPKQKPPPLVSELPAKHGKFFDLIFTQALASDYRRQAQDQEMENNGAGDSSAVSAASESFSSIKGNVSELICSLQAFDLLINHHVVDSLLLTFSPITRLHSSFSHQDSSLQHSIDLPVLYITVSGVRLFLPSISSKACQKSDDVLMFCLGNIDVNPRPQNPLSRLVLAPSIYRKATSAGLLHCAGSPLEDKQFEIMLQDISLGTTKSNDIALCLKKTVHCENPALQWNISGDSLKMSDPVFHPVIEQFDVQTIIAPSMWHTNSFKRSIMVCGPSMEVNVMTDIVLHVTAMQLSVVQDVGTTWSTQHQRLQAKEDASFQTAENVSSTKPGDSVYSVCESSHPSDKAIFSANARLLGDYLLIAKKIKIFFYRFNEDDSVTPLSRFEVHEPSFVFHVSKHQQKIELQFHNAAVNVSGLSAKTASSVDDHANFSVNFLETLSGECDKRTGVPPSLCTITASHFLTKKATFKVQFGRPVKLSVQQHVVTTFQEILKDVELVLNAKPKANLSSAPVKNDFDFFSQTFSSFQFETCQFVVQVSNENHCLRVAFATIAANMQETSSSLFCDFIARDLSVRLQPFKKDFMSVLHPVTFSSKIKIHSYKPNPPVFYVTANLSVCEFVISKELLEGLIAVLDTSHTWLLDLFPSTEQGFDSSPVSVTQSVHKVDDIRTGSYMYITAEDCEPLPGQIIFSSKLPVSSMTWCYDRPYCIEHVSITPIPFNEILGDHSEISCTLESFNETQEVYEARKEFLLSETKHVEFSLYDDTTAPHDVITATKWRVNIHNTETCHVSPLSLAASMVVNSHFDVRYLPIASVTLTLENLRMTAITPQDNGVMENLQIDIHNFNTSFRSWDKNMSRVIFDADFGITANVMEFHNLSWLPVLLPVSINVNMMKMNKEVTLSCNFKNLTEVHVSQRSIHSLQYLASTWTKPNIKQTFSPPIVLINHTCATILLGQAMTDECITLISGEKSNYSWRTTKSEPKLRISGEGLPDWIWSAPFSVFSPQKFCCTIDQMHSIIVVIESLNSKTITVSFHGRTRIANRLSESLQARLMVRGKIISSNCAVTTDPKEDLLFSISEISTIVFKATNGDFDASMNIFTSDLVEFAKNGKLVKISIQDKEVINAQVCHYQKDLVDIIAILPLFIIRSFLPNPVLLHVETRCQQKSLLQKLQGNGSQILLPSLSPFETHHLTVQLNETESPFDATVPIHFSLCDTLPDSANLHHEPLDLCQHYPYNDHQYTSGHGEEWSPGDGSIQAKLSLHSSSLLVEVIPWCLFSNQTNIVLCITSPDDGVSIIQPGQIATPHHFTGMFHIRSTNSSCSEWMTLSLSSELNHPSRAEKLKQNHVPFNGTRNIILRKKTSLTELCLYSCIRHGIRVVTISPTWWFVNLSSHYPDMKVLPCVNQQAQHLQNQGDAIKVTNGNPIPLLDWILEPAIVPDDSEKAIIEDGDNDVKDISVQSSIEETTSSFLCIDLDPYELSLQTLFSDRSLCFHASSLVAMVSVKDAFDRRLVEFHSQLDTVLCNQLVLTKHSNHGQSYIILNDIKKRKYIFYNHTGSTIHLQEVTDRMVGSLEVVISPSSSAHFESFMDAEMFPRCMRRYRSIKMQIRETGCDTWTDFLVSVNQGKDELLLPEAKILFFKAQFENGCIDVHFFDKQNEYLLTETSALEKGTSYTAQLTLNEVKVVLFDDLSNPLYSVDLMQACLDEIEVQLTNSELAGKWIVKLLFTKFQLDNQLYPNSDFPVFLASATSDMKAFASSLVFSENFLLEKIEVFLEPLELQSDSSFAQSFSRLLQLYMESSQIDIEKHMHTNSIPSTVFDEMNVLVNPLRCQAFIIHPVTLLVSLRAAMKVSLSVDRGSVSFSKFACRDVDTTFHEIVQELTRHYFAEAIYGAGWVIGSLDILGNPASTIRSFVQGISDFVVMPYQGLMNGPTAFIGGFTRGFSSLLKHLSAGTLRSVTNIASGISRNLDYGAYSQHQNIQTSQFLLETKFQESKKVEQATSKASQSYVSGVTKALVGVVAKPIGGAAGLVSKTGESILRKVGLEEHKSVRHSSASHPISSYKNSITKYSQKVISEKPAALSLLASLECVVLCTNGVSFPAMLLLSAESLFIMRLEDDIMETSLLVKEIDLLLDKSESKMINLTLQSEPLASDDKKDVYTEKVADYLGVNSSPTNNLTKSADMVKYTIQVASLGEAELFLSILRLLKPKSNRFCW